MLLVSACSSLGTVSSKPHTPDNLCGIFAQFKDWQTSAIASEQQWKIDQSISMAFINHESDFNAKARPPRKRTFGIIPGKHLSSAYGYPQAINGTWLMYKQLTGYTNAQRTDFNDAIDFVGWYNARSVRLNNIQPNVSGQSALNYPNIAKSDVKKLPANLVFQFNGVRSSTCEAG